MAAAPTVEAQSTDVARPAPPIPWHYAAWAEACPGAGDGSHRLYVAGYLRRHDPLGLRCDRPLLGLCRDCPARTSLACGSRRGSKCGPCSDRHRTRVRRIVADGLDRRSGTGHANFLTFTAPGEEPHRRLFFDGTWHRGMYRPPCSCHEHLADGLGVWNATAGSRWNHLRTSLAREYPDMAFWRVVEVQVRGALHLHVVFWTPQPLDGRRIADLALAAGFGCSTQVEPIVGDVSRYVTKAISGYVSKAVDARESVPWETLDHVTGEAVEHAAAPYRVTSQSRSWGLTHRAIRHAVATAARRRAAQLLALEVPAATVLFELDPAAAPPPDPG